MSPSSPNGEDATSSRFVQLPPPPAPASGSADAPAPIAPPATAGPPAPTVPTGPPTGYPAYPGYAPAPTLPPGHDDREHRPGTNGLAIAALCCGIVGLVPLASVAAIVLGIIALSQLRRVVQAGRGMAIAGIVLGSVWILGILALVTFAVSSDPGTREGSASASGSGVHVDDLRTGECFDGLPADLDLRLGRLTTRSCTEPHQSQVAATVTLPSGDWPGVEKAAELAEAACTDAVDAVVRDRDSAGVDLVYVYPQSSLSWRLDRGVVCILDAGSARLTRSLVQNY